ncbi:MAG: lipid II:glycine glycyltransferase FemX [Thermomicrobiales bacterium]
MSPYGCWIAMRSVAASMNGKAGRTTASPRRIPSEVLMCASFDTIWIWAIGRPGSSWPGVQCSSRVSCSVTGMRKDTRYNVQYAQRRGVSIERMEAGKADIATFYRLLQETSQRQKFGIHTSRYYDDFMRLFGDQAVLLLARAGGEVTAGLIAARCGAEGRSMYAGSSSHHRVRGDAALLRFEAMRWTRAHGGDRYDLGGIISGPRPSGSDVNSQSSGKRGSNLDGVTQFKLGFGGEIVAYPPTLERRYRPALSWVVRQFHPRFRQGRAGA